MNWGYRIVVAYLLFALILGVLAFKSFRSKVSLVAPDYYRQEIAYQEQIDKIENAANLEHPLTIELDNEKKVLVITFPPQQQQLSGEVTFYRPSNAQMDRFWKITPNHQNQQLIALQTVENGLWKVQVTWKADDKSYYQHKNVYIP